MYTETTRFTSLYGGYGDTLFCNDIADAKPVTREEMMDMVLDFVGESIKDHASGWIWENDDDDNVEKFRLYAEIVIPDGIDEWDADDYGYDELEKEIMEQAREHGLNPENIEINI